MANRLKTAMVNAILVLKQRGWSSRRIARELGIDRETVRRHLQGANEGSNPARNASPESREDSNPATNAPSGSLVSSAEDQGEPSPLRTGSPSQCEPYRAVIQTKLEQKLSAQRIYQDLVTEHGFTGSYYSVRRFVRHLDPPMPLPFRRLECSPGEQAQLDFGRGAPIITPEGHRRSSHVLRVVLSCSRKGYSESFYRQTTDALITCLENAFRHWGGAPRTLVLDNQKAAVSQADWYDPDLNPKLRSFAEYYGTVILPIKPYTPRHQGKAERGIGYVKNNALKDRAFSGIEQENAHLLEWETHTADTRIHGTTRRQVGQFFEEVERPALLPLPPQRFPCFQEAKRCVHRDGHIEVNKAYYSAPPEYVGHQVWVRWDGHLVRIFNLRMESLIVHARVEPGRFQTCAKHLDPRKISGVERGTVWLLQRAHLIGPHTEHWAQAMLEARGLPGIRVLAGLLSLTRHYETAAMEKACEIAYSHQAFRLRTIRQLLQRGGSQQQVFEFIAQHPLIRDLRDYGELVRKVLG